MPSSLERLILSRVDHLTEGERLTLKVASILGRVFRWAHLVGYYTSLGTAEQVQSELAALEHQDLVMQEPSSPELTYLFKHILTQQVAYESLAYSTRERLHTAYAQFLETQTDRNQLIDLIAFHYDHSDNAAKRLEYLTLAGGMAAARFANSAAVDYLTRALGLTATTDPEARCRLLTAREQVYDVMGDREHQRADLAERAGLAIAIKDAEEQIKVTLRQGWLAERTADYGTAISSAENALAMISEAPLPEVRSDPLAADAHALWGQALLEMGEWSRATLKLERALELAQNVGDESGQARALDLMGTTARFVGEFARARSLHERALPLARAAGDRRREWWTLNDLAAVAHSVGSIEQAVEYYTQALGIVQDIGDRRGQATLLSNLGWAYSGEGEHDRALIAYEQARALAEAVQDRRSTLRVLVNLGETYRLVGEYARAREVTLRAAQLARDLADRLGEMLVLVNLGAIELARGALSEAHTTAGHALELAKALGRRESEAFVLNTLGAIALARNEPTVAVNYFEQARAVWDTL